MFAAARPAGAAGDKRTGVYVLENFQLRAGAQVPRMHEYFSKLVVASLERAKHSGPVIFLEALVAPHMPQVAAIYGFRSMEDMWALHTRSMQDTETIKSFEQWENAADPPYEQLTSTVLEATDYSPEIVKPAERPKSPRIFELRVYHSPTWRQLKALHERFAGPEIQIFHRVGVHPILYTSTLFGPNMPNLTYLIPFDNLAAREKAWDAFGSDPEWVKVRKDSVEKHGQIASVIQISLFKATPYSPIQ
jgi:hypothetical protein